MRPQTMTASGRARGLGGGRRFAAGPLRPRANADEVHVLRPRGGDVLADERRPTA
jgi:hypothetical protein